MSSLITKSELIKYYDRIKALEPYLLDVMREHHLPSRGSFRCINPEHGDENPSMSYDRHHNVLHCFACRENYHTVDAVMALDNLSFLDALAYCEKTYLGKVPSAKFKETNNRGETVYDFTGVLSDAKQDLALKYLVSRGFRYADDFVKRFSICDFKNNVLIPHVHYIIDKTIDGGGKTKITDYVVRLLHPNHPYCRYYRSRDTKITLYDPTWTLNISIRGMAGRKNPILLFVSEGEFDALSYYDALFNLNATNKIPKECFKVMVRSIATSSVDNLHLLEAKLGRMPASFKERLYIVPAFDNDKVGLATNTEFITYLEKNNYHYLKVPNFLGLYKDANEYLAKDPSSFDSLLLSCIRSVNKAYTSNLDKLFPLLKDVSAEACIVHFLGGQFNKPLQFLLAKAKEEDRLHTIVTSCPNSSYYRQQYGTNFKAEAAAKLATLEKDDDTAVLGE